MTDRRILRTRQAVLDAFGRLIVKRDYEKISVQDIIDEADVGRSTFYAHFETKDDVLRIKCGDLFAHVFSVHEKERMHDFTGRDSLEARVAHILHHLYEEKEVIRGILSGSGREIFLDSFRAGFAKTLKDFPPRTSALPADFAYSHLTESLVGALRYWIRKDFSGDPDFIARCYILAVENIL